MVHLGIHIGFICPLWNKLWIICPQKKKKKIFLLLFFFVGFNANCLIVLLIFEDFPVWLSGRILRNSSDQIAFPTHRFIVCFNQNKNKYNFSPTFKYLILFYFILTCIQYLCFFFFLLEWASLVYPFEWHAPINYGMFVVIFVFYTRKGLESFSFVFRPFDIVFLSCFFFYLQICTPLLTFSFYVWYIYFWRASFEILVKVVLKMLKTKPLSYLPNMMNCTFPRQNMYCENVIKFIAKLRGLILKVDNILPL